MIGDFSKQVESVTSCPYCSLWQCCSSSRRCRVLSAVGLHVKVYLHCKTGWSRLSPASFFFPRIRISAKHALQIPCRMKLAVVAFGSANQTKRCISGYKEGNPTDVTELLKVSAPFASEILVASTPLG